LGDIIKKIVALVTLTMLSVLSPVGALDILGEEIYETKDVALQFPTAADTNYDTLVVGDDRATAFGQIDPIDTATNNLEIKKNQDNDDPTYVGVNL
jgi:hypothetical protein